MNLTNSFFYQYGGIIRGKLSKLAKFLKFAKNGVIILINFVLTLKLFDLLI